MIKVIRKGKRKEIAQIKCLCCRSILEYGLEDVKKEQQYNDINYYITCPICGNTLTVTPSSDFPWEE